MIELKNFNILFVEDDSEIQTNMRRILNMIFNKVFIACDGVKALEIFNNNLIHIVVTDYEMPNMNGYDLAKQIREINQKIPIVILSNYTDKDKLLKCIPLNLTDYLEKPVIYEKLIEVLELCVKQIEDSSVFQYQLDEHTLYNFRTKEIIQAGKNIKLTSLEITIFEYMLNHKNQLILKERLLTLLNKEVYEDNVSLKNIIYRLKKKINDDHLIVNQKNLGYMLIIK